MILLSKTRKNLGYMVATMALRVAEPAKNTKGQLVLQGHFGVFNSPKK